MAKLIDRQVAWLLGAGLGLGTLLVYLNFALEWVVLSQRLALALAFAIGPVAILGITGMTKRFERVYAGGTLRVGTVYLVVAFALLTLMVTMQQAVAAEYDRLLADTGSSDASLRGAFALVNHVQLGADVAFDIFYSLGIILISVALLRHRGFPLVVGVYGLGAGAGLLSLNIWFFPTPPAAAGSLDLGPATIAWWIGIIALDRRLKRGKARTVE